VTVTPNLEPRFRRLSVAEGRGVYRFALTEDAAFRIDGATLPNVSFRDGNGVEWARLVDNVFVVRCGYQWNGSSPKRGRRLFGRDVWFGTPDFEGTITASLFHDALYQFAQTRHFPFAREQCDCFYRQLCDRYGFKLAPVYHSALWAFSAKAFNSSRTNGEHSVLLD